jgi:hypothetical protein
MRKDESACVRACGGYREGANTHDATVQQAQECLSARRCPATTIERTVNIFKVGSKLTLRYILYCGSRSCGVTVAVQHGVTAVSSCFVWRNLWFSLLTIVSRRYLDDVIRTSTLWTVVRLTPMNVGLTLERYNLGINDSVQPELYNQVAVPPPS